MKERKYVNICEATFLTSNKLSNISPSLKNRQPSILPASPRMIVGVHSLELKKPFPHNWVLHHKNELPYTTFLV
jgi:hypothetical protein